MTTYFAKSTMGFYDTDISADLPADAVQVSDAERSSALAAQASGGSIGTDANGKPVPIFPTLSEMQVALCAQIDFAADAAYINIGGPSPGRLAEYQQANSDAIAFKASGYVGSIPETVQCWATASGMTAQAAADSILATAAEWMAVLNGVRSARLIGKRNVNEAATLADAQAAAATAITNVNAAAGSA